MGSYTEHWNQYKRQSVRGVVYLLLLFAVGLPLTAIAALGVQKLTGTYPFHFHISLLIVWLVSFTVLAVRYSRVVCPRCNAKYSRGRWLCDCPRCGLRMLQDDP